MSAVKLSTVSSSIGQSENGFFKLDKSQYAANGNPPDMITITEKVNGANGTVVFTITKPDGTTMSINRSVTNIGEFRTLIIIDESFPPRSYTISGNYRNLDLGLTTFIIK